MVKNNNSSPQPSPLSLVRGETVTATYIEQRIPEYQLNPAIEALPPLMEMSEVTEALSYFPHYEAEQRRWSSHERLHLLDNCREFFLPQGIHYEIHLSISNMLRRGYIDRNPITIGMRKKQAEKLRQLSNRLQRRAFLRSKARGLCIVGVSGVGKSTAVENILSLYPQVITHTKYKGKDLILQQLVWVKLQCPSDGSLRGLCINYIKEVDDILGTNYTKTYDVKHRIIDELLLIMGQVASNQFQGLLVFDEIQDLSEAKSGGASRMLNFFVQLENTLGIPFILIGTPKAKELLLGEFRQARRVSEQGDIYWRPMQEIAVKGSPKDPDVIDHDWNVFVRAMWRYWYLQKEHNLPNNLLKDQVVRALYKESKGITALIVTIFFLAQRRAIISGREDLTVGIIKSVVRDNLYLIDQLFERVRVRHEINRKPKSASDLDSMEWQPNKSTYQKNDESKKPVTKVDDGTKKQPSSTSKAEHLPQTKSGRASKPTRQVRELAEGDFRALASQLNEPESAVQSLPTGNYFADTDKFS